MTRTEARRIAKQMIASTFPSVSLNEDFVTGEVTIVAINRGGRKRVVASTEDWIVLREFEGVSS